MEGLTARESHRMVNRYIGVDGGHLGDFSFRTLNEFFAEYCDLRLNLKQADGTKREQFEAVLERSPPAMQARIVRGVLDKYPPSGSPPTRTQELHDELSAVAARLEGTPGVATPSLATTTKAVELALSNAETLVTTTGAPCGVDRVHTALHAYLRAVCAAASIAFTSDHRVDELFSFLRAHHPAFAKSAPKGEETVKICRALATVMQVLNPIRNSGSLAHPPEELLDPPEAMLVINVTRTMLAYINAKLDCAGG